MDAFPSVIFRLEVLQEVQELFAEQLEDKVPDWAQLDIKPGSLLVQLVDRVYPQHASVLSEVIAKIELLKVQGISELHVLCSLTAAAIVEWVFQQSAANLFVDRFQGFCSPAAMSAYARALTFVALRGMEVRS
jgi:hypothetical protein